MKYLLDTDICINIIRSKEDSLLRKFVESETNSLSASSVSAAELEYGVFKSSSVERNAYALTCFFTLINVESFDTQAAREYGKIRAELESQGKRIGPYDLMIAAHALSLGFTLVTNNIREFKRVEGLKLESWHEIELC